MPTNDEFEFGPGEDPTAGFFSFTGADAPVSDPTGVLQQQLLQNLVARSAPPPPPSQGARTAANLLALLLGAGGVAGVGQQLFGRPGATTQQPRLSPQQLSLLGRAQGQFGQTGNILQQLMGMIQQPQIPPGLSALVEQAFQPRFGNVASQAIESARRRGFAGGAELLQSGPGGAIAGPALSDLQGQMAQAKLNLYQNQIGNLLQALQGSQGLGQSQGQLASALPTQVRQQAPQPSILQTLGGLSPILNTVGGILGAANPRGATGSPFDFSSLLSGLNPFSRS